MMLKVDEVKEGTTTKAFDYSFKSSNNQTYRIILSLFDNDTRFTINMTEKTEKICFSTEFTTQERVNQCSKGIFNRIDFFYYSVLSVFEKNEADGKVTKEGTFQLILPYSIMNNKVENMIIDVGLVENDEVWRLKQTILDLQESLANLTPEIVTFDEGIKNLSNNTLIFTHRPKKKGNVMIQASCYSSSTVSLNVVVENISRNLRNCTNYYIYNDSCVFSAYLDGKTDIKFLFASGGLSNVNLKLQLIIMPAQEIKYTLKK
ncbi:hypothetical protein ABK040_006218 [Willaertia magna]